jgi:hypothetical protein
MHGWLFHNGENGTESNERREGICDLLSDLVFLLMDGRPGKVLRVYVCVILLWCFDRWRSVVTFVAWLVGSFFFASGLRSISIDRQNGLFSRSLCP